VTLAIRAGRLIDGTGKASIADATLVVDDHGRIEAVGPTPSVSVPAGVRTVELAGRTVLPGLHDCHVHFVFSGGTDPLGDVLREDDLTLARRASANARRALAAGVTTVRDLGGRGGTLLALRDAIGSGLLPGPRVLVHGAPITLTGGHCYFLGMEADTEDDVRRAVRLQVRQGVDGLKIMTTGGRLTPRTNPTRAQYTVAQLAAAVDETRRARLKIAAHGHGAEGIRNAVAARVDTVEHCSWVVEHDGVEAVVLDAEAAYAMATHGIFVVPTLMPAAIAQQRAAGSLSEGSRRNARIRPDVIASHRQMRAMGVRFAAGTDSGVVMTPADGLPFELQLMVNDLGFTPLEAIRAATGDAAIALGVEHDRGTLRPGQRADLLVVDGDPALDITALRHVRSVFQDGQLVVQDGLVRDAPLA
jgi:imidazolonepropionase-like amidohydrolase